MHAKMQRHTAGVLAKAVVDHKYWHRRPRWAQLNTLRQAPFRLR